MSVRAALEATVHGAQHTLAAIDHAVYCEGCACALISPRLRELWRERDVAKAALNVALAALDAHDAGDRTTMVPS